jgi:hypothetical protein
MLLAFCQQLPPSLATDRHQGVKLLVELLGATTHARFGQFFQPGVTMTRGIDLVIGAGNRPASIEGFETIHHLSEIFVNKR